MGYFGFLCCGLGVFLLGSFGCDFRVVLVLSLFVDLFVGLVLMVCDSGAC